MIRHVPPDDPRVADYAHVGDPEWLRRQGLFVAEGRLLLQRLSAAPGFEAVSVLVTPAAARALEEYLARLPADVLVVDPGVVNRITGFNFHRGCLALVRRPPDLAPADLPAAGCRLGLEGVGNPDNVGGLFRTAAAFGVRAVVLDGASGDPFYRKALRTSMGAVLRVPFARVHDWARTLRQLQAEGWLIVALTPAACATPLEEFAARIPAAQPRLVLVGSEGPGLGGATLECADARVRIPITSRVDSLNVVVAAGIALSRLAA